MNFIFKLFPWIFGFMFLFIIGMFAFQGVIAYKAYNAIDQQGLKGVSEQIWCGKDKSEECKEDLRKTISESLNSTGDKQ